MLDIALKNIGRQRTRTFLTVLGIVIGITAIVALGSIAEGIDNLVQTSMEKMVGKIMVFQTGASFMSFFADSHITDEQVEEILDVPGVKDAVPLAFKIVGSASIGFSQSEVVIGIPPDKTDYFTGERIKMYEGRNLETGDEYEAVIGKDIAEKYNLGVGDEYDVENEPFSIIGILEKTDDSELDSGIIVPLEPLRDLLHLEDEVPLIYAIPEDIADTEIVADNIKDLFEDINAVTDLELSRQVGAMVSNIRLFTMGIAAIAAIVGGLGVMNTMIMAVMERRREIGVMKALGATKRMILMQFLTESSLMSLFGGIIGVVLGTLLSIGIGIFSGFSVTPVVTPALALTGVAFAFLLGIVGGIYPSRKAANLDAVEALRYE